MTMTLVSTTTLSSTTASITFSSIPQTATDLLVVYSVRITEAVVIGDMGMQINATTTGYSDRLLGGTGSSVFSQSISSGTYTKAYLGFVAGNSATASTFGSGQVYIPNYTGSTNKSFSIDAVGENNATQSGLNIDAGLWANTAAITSLTFLPFNAGINLASGTTISLYTITKGSGGATVA